MKMVRKQLYITQEQDEKLKRLAAARGSTEADVVRAAIDSVAEVTYLRAEARDLPRIRETAVKERYMARESDTLVRISADDRRIVLEESAWEEELAFIRSLAAKGGEGRVDAGWRFDREEIYEDRVSKILR